MKIVITMMIIGSLLDNPPHNSLIDHNSIGITPLLSEVIAKFLDILHIGNHPFPIFPCIATPEGSFYLAAVGLGLLRKRLLTKGYKKIFYIGVALDDVLEQINQVSFIIALQDRLDIVPFEKLLGVLEPHQQ